MKAIYIYLFAFVSLNVNAAGTPTMPDVAGSYVCKVQHAPRVAPEIAIEEREGLLYFDDYFAGFFPHIGNQGLPCQNVKVKTDNIQQIDVCNGKAVGRQLIYTAPNKKAYKTSLTIMKSGKDMIKLSFQEWVKDQNEEKYYQLPKFNWSCKIK